MSEETTKTLLNFIIDEMKELKQDIKEIKSSMVTKDYCRTMQEDCPIKEDLADTQKKTNLNLAK